MCDLAGEGVELPLEGTAVGRRESVPVGKNYYKKSNIGPSCLACSSVHSTVVTPSAASSYQSQQMLMQHFRHSEPETDLLSLHMAQLQVLCYSHGQQPRAAQYPLLGISVIGRQSYFSYEFELWLHATSLVSL